MIQLNTNTDKLPNSEFFFHGTKLYTLGFELITVYVKTMLILLFGHIGATDLFKCLNHLAKFYRILKKKSDELAEIVQ
jgi:hypothetical protein